MNLKEIVGKVLDVTELAGVPVTRESGKESESQDPVGTSPLR